MQLRPCSSFSFVDRCWCCCCSCSCLHFSETICLVAVRLLRSEIRAGAGNLFVFVSFAIQAGPVSSMSVVDRRPGSSEQRFANGGRDVSKCVFFMSESDQYSAHRCDGRDLGSALSACVMQFCRVFCGRHRQAVNIAPRWLIWRSVWPVVWFLVGTEITRASLPFWKHSLLLTRLFVSFNSLNGSS